MCRFVILAFLLCQLHPLIAASGGNGVYTIVTPGTIHPNTLYNVLVSVHEAAETCKVKLKLNGPDFERQKEVEVPPKSTVNVGFEIPDIQSGQYTLNVDGVSGMVFHNSTELNFDDNKPSVFIQTDKAKYKPGDLVHFRVVFLDHNLRPANLNKVMLFVKDAAKNRIKQYKNLTLMKGVLSEKLQLSEFPVLGEWEIEVQVDGAPVAKKAFDVDEYVLPKFDVTINTPKKVWLMEDKFGFTVRSKYTFGKGVTGKAKIKVITRVNSPYGYQLLYNSPYERRDYFVQPQIVQYNPSSYFPNPHSSFIMQKEIQKNIDINGKSYVEFEMDDIKPEGFNKPSTMNAKIIAIVEEELTGNKRNTTSELTFVWNRFEIEAPSVTCSTSNEKLIYPVTITDLEHSPISDLKNPVKLSIQSNITMESFLNDKGIANFELKCPEGYTFLSTRVEYRGETANGHINKVQERFDDSKGVLVRTKNSHVGDDIEIEVKSDNILSSFVYVIAAHGNILQSKYVDLSGKNTKNHKFKVVATFEMVPLAQIYVYYVKDDNLKFWESEYNVEKSFLNKISIDAPRQAKPGQDVTIKITTDIDSYVGLTAVDQSVLLLKSGNEFEKEKIFDSINKMKSRTPTKYTSFIEPHPGAKLGVITLTNAHYPSNERYFYNHVFEERHYDHRIAYEGIGFRGPPMPSNVAYSSYMPGASSFMRTGSPGPPGPPPTAPPPMAIQPRIRKDFSESWFVADFPSSGETNLTFSKPVPDTITSWIISGFSVNPKTGFTLSENPTKVETFRPFFIKTNLPYSVKRGEVVTIPVLVFNYMDQPLEVTVTLENSDGEFKFNDKISDQNQRVEPVTVAPNNVESVKFVIRPERIGQIVLKLTAVSHIAGDAIHKKLKVEAEGITMFENRDFFVQATEGQTFSEKLALDIPKEVVSDSEHIEISLMGDILGSTVSNFDKLVRMPSGCGEQNMVNFVPNILVLRYLESIHQLSPPIEKKAKGYLEIGYQRELTYKHDNGSYSAFGKSDKFGSTWLTAYVMRSFHQAARYTDIDKKVLSEGLDFLSSIQAPNGSFPEYGKVLDFSHQNEVGLTAFVLLAFLENTESLSKYKDVIDNGFKFLEDNIKKTDDLYATSIAVYALQLHKSDLVPDILKKLDVDARVDGGRKWWTKAVAELRTDQSWRPKSHDVEVTGYILMTLLEMNKPVLPITKWLISQRNSNGGFASTQETVVGLQALIKFAEKSGPENADLTIEFDAKGEDNKAHNSKLHVNKDNTLEVTTEVLPNWAREISVTGKGTGTAVLQISYRYNIELKDKKPSFNLKTKHTPNSSLQKLDMEVCAEFTPQDSATADQQSNMVVMEVNLPSGYAADAESFNNIKNVADVKRVETKNSDTNVVIYFDGLDASNVRCVPVQADRLHEVSEQKPVPIVIYDYYDNQKRATEFYSV